MSPNAVFGSNCVIYQNVTIGRRDIVRSPKAPCFGDNITVCAGACVLGDIKIGDNAIIGANAVVLVDVPHNCIAIGVPARIMQKEKKQDKSLL